jgi:hypothetical protein
VKAARIPQVLESKGLVRVERTALPCSISQASVITVNEDAKEARHAVVRHPRPKQKKADRRAPQLRSM